MPKNVKKGSNFGLSNIYSGTPSSTEARPPSLITPEDDGEAVALSVLSTSLNSDCWGQPESLFLPSQSAGENLFSPRQFFLSPNLSAPASMISATRIGSAQPGLRFDATLSPATLISI